MHCFNRIAVSFFVFIIACLLAVPANADLTQDEARNYIRTTWKVYSATDDTLNILLQRDFPGSGITWKDIIGGLITADEVMEDLRQDRPNDAAYHALVWGSKQVIKSSLKSLGYQSVASTASLATLPIEYSLLRFEQEAQQLALLNQMRLYFAARGLGLSKDQILAMQEPTNGNVVQYTDAGWLYIVEDIQGNFIHSAWGNHPSNLTVHQTYDICEEAYRAHLVSQAYSSDKQNIGEQLLSELEGVALIRTTPSWATAPASVTFDASVSKPKAGTTITAYDWTFWDGMTSHSVQVTKSVYQPNQSCPVSLTVHFSDGTSNTNSINYAAGLPSFQVTPDAMNPRRITFTAPSSSLIASYQWSLGDGSTTSGRTVTHNYPDFGKYSVTLTITATNGSVLPSVTQEIRTGFFGPTYIYSSTISGNNTWVAAASPYVITQPLTIAAGATLTIGAGTTVKISGASSSIIVNGGVVAQGTAESPICFTSFKDDSTGGDTNGDGSASAPAAGDWSRIAIYGGSATLDHCIVRYGGAGGSSHYPGSIYCESNTVTISNSQILDAGICCKSSSPVISNCSITGGVRCYGVKNLYSFGYSPPGSSPTITGCNITEGIVCHGGSSPTITGCTISSTAQAINCWSSNDAPSVTGCTLSTPYSFYAIVPATIVGQLVCNNTFSGNADGAISVIGSCSLNGQNHWRALPNMRVYYLDPGDGYYRIYSNITIPEGASLTLDPGVVIKSRGATFCPNYQCNYYAVGFDVSGSLTAQGTAESPICFTSFKDDSTGGDTNGDGSASAPAAGDWSRIAIYGGSATLDHCIVRYGGAGGSANLYGQLVASAGSILCASACTFGESSGYGVHLVSTSANFRNCIFAGPMQLSCDSAALSYCCFSPSVGYNLGTNAQMTGCITAEPLFASSYDYRLRPESPCIDSGDPSILDPDGSRSDMGAYPYVGGRAVTVSDVKAYGKGIMVRLKGKVVTAVFEGRFYVEELGRSSGIGIAASRSVNPGDMVSILGTLDIVNGEKCLVNPDVEVLSPENTIPPRLFVTNGSLGGGDWRYIATTGTGQKGVAGASGLNNIGLLIKTCGRFTYVDQSTFIIDDGSGVNVKCVVPDGVVLDQNWTYVSVTGISSCEMDGSELHRLIRVRKQTDIVSYQ